MILLQVWVTKECVLDGFHVSLNMKWREQDWKYVSNYSPSTKVKAVISVEHYHRGHELGASLQPGTKRPVTWYHHPTSPRKIKFKAQNSAGRCMLTVFWNYWGIIHLVCLVKGMKVKFDLSEYPEEVERDNQSHLLEKKSQWMLLQRDNTRPLSSAATSVVIENIRL